MVHDRFQPEGGHLCYDIQHHRGTCRLHRIRIGPFRSFIIEHHLYLLFLRFSIHSTTQHPHHFSVSARDQLHQDVVCARAHIRRSVDPDILDDCPTRLVLKTRKFLILVLMITWIYGFLCPLFRNNMKSTLLAWISRQQIYSPFFRRGKQFRNYCDTHVLPFHPNSIRIQQQSPCQRFTRPN